MDPLVDVLTVLRAEGYVSSTLVADGPRWRLRFDAPAGMKFNAVRDGACYLTTAGLEQPLRLVAGDCFVLTRSQPFELAGDPTAPPRPAGEVFSTARDGVARLATGCDCEPGLVALGGGFRFDGPVARLTDSLAPVIHVPAGTPDAESVQRTLADIDEELRAGRAGAGLVTEHLAVVLLVRVVRWQVAHDPPSRGWLRGLTDPVVASALEAIHADPAHPWTVRSLADASHVSRSTLAQRFKDVVGSGPVEYLVDWRMELAARQLARSDASVAGVGRSLGYSSESAFSTAFRRVRGVSPSQARRGSQQRA